MKLKKSDSMLQQEKWAEEVMRNKPKRTREGLPIQPIHGLFFLCFLLILVMIIGYLLHR